MTQRMDALNKANLHRYERAKVKRRIYALPPKESKEAVAELFLNPPKFMHTMKVADLLKAGRRMGPQMTRRWMRKANISDVTTIECLTKRQTTALVGVLRG